MLKLIGASLWYQGCWFLAVLGTEHWQWLLIVLAMGSLAYLWVVQGIAISRFVAMLATGLFVDAMNIYCQVLIFPNPGMPLWLMGLWGMFIWYAIQILPTLLRWQQHWLILGGGLGGALSYLAGAALDAARVISPTWLAFGLLFCEWVILTWILIEIFCYENTRALPFDE